MTKDKEWDHKENLYIEPCACNYNCGQYILFMKGDRTHFRNAPENEFISTASLSVGDMFDLHENLSEKLDIECQRMDLEELLDKNDLPAE